MCGDGAEGRQAQSPNVVFPRGLANLAEATRDREAVPDVRGDQRTHFDSALL
jgi:hypothetical protein